MKLATTTGDFIKYGLTPKESIEEIIKAGFKNIDYSFGYDHKNSCGFYSDNWQNYADELLEMAAKKGFRFVQSHSPMGYPIKKDENQAQFIEDTKRSIEAAAYLGIPNIVVHAGHVSGISKQENFRLNKLFYEEILKTAEKSGTLVLTENFNKMCIENYYWPDNAQDVCELVDYINHPLLKLCWDTGHGNQQPLPQYDALTLLGDRVAAIHVQDNLGFLDDHTMPFVGTLNVDSLMLGLLEIGFNGYFTFEADCIPLNPSRRNADKRVTKFTTLPLEIGRKFEALLYEVGKHLLTEYNCFEE